MSGPACRAVHTTIWTPECTHPAGHEGAHSWATGHGQGREDRWRSPAAWRALLDAAEARAAKAEKERDDRRFAAWCPRCESWQAPELVGLDGRCVDAEAVKAALLRADTDARVKAEWEKLFNERNRLWREEADRVDAVTLLLEANGCDCDCDHDAESHDADCDRCLACRISWAAARQAWPRCRP